MTLHSYRCAWAERAKKAAYPKRFAQQALGQNSKAVHQTYAKKAKVILPPLEVYEEQLSHGSAAEDQLPRLTSSRTLVSERR